MKAAFLALVLANVLLYAWQQGLLGFTPETGREPQRTTQQVAPETLRVLTAAEIAKLRNAVQPGKDSAVTLSQSCLEFGDFSGEALDAIDGPGGVGRRPLHGRVAGVDEQPAHAVAIAGTRCSARAASIRGARWWSCIRAPRPRSTA